MAQSASPNWAVRVVSGGTDATGIRFVYAVKEELRKSSQFELVVTNPPDRATLVVELITADPNPEMTKGDSTVVSSVCTLEAPGGPYPYKFDHRLLVVGRGKLDESANRFVAELDRTWEATVKVTVEHYQKPNASDR